MQSRDFQHWCQATTATRFFEFETGHMWRLWKQKSGNPREGAHVRAREKPPQRTWGKSPSNNESHGKNKIDKRKCVKIVWRRANVPFWLAVPWQRMPAQRQARDAAQLISQLTLYTGNRAHYHHTLQSLPSILHYSSRKKCSFLRFFGIVRKSV